MIYLILFLEFCKVGLFTVGGGLAALPFLYDLTEKYTWFDQAMMADMIAISQSTPGPIGINMATYAGYNAGGILGGILATLGFVTPSLIIIITIARFLDKFKESKIVDNIFTALRPAVCGLIAIAWFEIMKISIFTVSKFIDTKNILNIVDIELLIIFISIFYAIKKFDKHPIVYILIGAILGIVLKL